MRRPRTSSIVDLRKADGRFPDLLPPIPELVRVADLLEARFAEPPWEDLRESLDGDFLYLTVGGWEAGAEVEDYIVRVAPDLGLLVYSPLRGREESVPVLTACRTG